MRSFKCPLMSYYEALSSEKPWHTVETHIVLNMFRRLRQRWLYQIHPAQVYKYFLIAFLTLCRKFSNVHQTSYYLQERAWFRQNPRRSARWHQQRVVQWSVWCQKCGQKIPNSLGSKRQRKVWFRKFVQSWFRQSHSICVTGIFTYVYQKKQSNVDN